MRRKIKEVLATALAMTLLFTSAPGMALAEEQPHEHDDTCGYSPESPCNYNADFNQNSTDNSSGTETLLENAEGAAGSDTPGTLPAAIDTTASASVAGTVLTDNGTPLSNYEILVIDNVDDIVASANTEANGSYSILQLKPGTYKIGVSGTMATADGDGFIPIEVGEGQSVNQDFRLPTDRILGALSKNVQNSDGRWVTIETVPTGKSEVIDGDTMLVSPYTFTRGDIRYAVESVVPDATEIPIEEITVDDKHISVDKSINYFGTDYKIADIVEIEGEKYIFHYGNEEYGEYGYIQLIGLSDGGLYASFDGKLPGDKEANGDLNVIAKNSIVNVNGVIYHVRYEVSFSGGTIIRYLYREGEDGKMLPAGAWEVYDTPLFHFNQGFAPKDFHKIMNVTFVTEGDRLIKAKSEFAYDISRIGNGNQPFQGNVGIIGTDTTSNKRKLFHLLSNGTYQEGTANPGTNCMYVSVEETSPFMIFSFNEINTEIPVKVVSGTTPEPTPELTPKPTPTPTPEPAPKPMPTSKPTLPKTTAAKITSPKTGDETDMAVWLVLVLLSGAAVTGVYIVRQRGNAVLVHRKERENWHGKKEKASHRN